MVRLWAPSSPLPLRALLPLTSLSTALLPCPSPSPHSANWAQRSVARPRLLLVLLPQVVLPVARRPSRLQLLLLPLLLPPLPPWPKPIVTAPQRLSACLSAHAPRSAPPLAWATRNDTQARRRLRLKLTDTRNKAAARIFHWHPPYRRL